MIRRPPLFIVHYSRSEPFRTISSETEDEQVRIISSMSPENAWGIERFKHPKYLLERASVEASIRQEFIELGGSPQLNHPIYCFLGRNEQFEQNPKNMAYAIYLRDIPSEHISFTYGDSMLAYIEKNRALSGEKYQNPLCAKLFRTQDLDSLFQDANFQLQDPLAIEAQLWIKPRTSVIWKTDQLK